MAELQLLVKDYIKNKGNAGATAAELSQFIQANLTAELSKYKLGLIRNKIIKNIREESPGSIWVTGTADNLEFFWEGETEEGADQTDTKVEPPPPPKADQANAPSDSTERDKNLADLEQRVMDLIKMSGRVGVNGEEINELIRPLFPENASNIRLGHIRRKIIDYINKMNGDCILLVKTSSSYVYLWHDALAGNGNQNEVSDAESFSDEIELGNDLFDADILTALGRKNPRKGWSKVAKCKGMDTEIFYPQRNGKSAARHALNICMNCTVRDDCLSFALATQEEWGVWGNRTRRERRIEVDKALRTLGREDEIKWRKVTEDDEVNNNAE